MKRALFVAALATTALGMPALVEELHIPVGTMAPEISGKAPGGKEVSLSTLRKNGPVFVVFWKERCPHNPRAAALFNSLAKAYGEKAPLVGVVTATEEGAARWAQQFQLTYPMLADSNRQITRDYKLVYSICTFEIGPDGKVAKVYPGYGSESMAALNLAMAAASGKKPEVDLSNAPPRLTWG